MTPDPSRRTERRLFGCAIGLTLTGFFLLWGAQQRPVVATDFLPFAFYAASLFVTHVFWRASHFAGSQRLTGSLAFLLGFGVLAQSRMTGGDAGATLPLAFPLGMAALLVVTLSLRRDRIAFIDRIAPLCGFLGLVLVAALLVLGHRFRGAIFGPGGMTPTELLKLFVIIFSAGFLADRQRLLDKAQSGIPPLRVLLPLVIYWVVLMGLLVLQRDLGMFVILSGGLLTMLFVQTRRWSYLFYAGIAGVGFAALAFSGFLHGQRRFAAWLDPFQDPTGSGWQILQGLSAMYSGGFWGTGFGQGQPGRIPIAASDFIYAVIGEEFGFIGCLLVVSFYLILFHEGFRIAFTAPKPFQRLLAGGITGTLAIQTLLNIGGVTKALPLTGVPLPFISHGGSSLVTTLVGLGILLVLSEPPVRKRRKASAAKKR